MTDLTQCAMTSPCGLQDGTRNRWKITEDEDWDGRTVVTVNFCDFMDAADFRRVAHFSQPHFTTVMSSGDHTT